MNIISFMHHDYEVKVDSESGGSSTYLLSFFCDSINDRELYHRVPRGDIETLRDNAKRLYLAIDEALYKDI